MSNPLLSICIPTYNRSIYLKDTIESIVCQKRFLKTNDVEIIVSDNCSTDDTYIVVETFINKYKDKVKYYRNDENIKDLNFEKVLSYGSGKFLKLNNDTLVHIDDSLDKMISFIKKNSDSDVLFFSNGTLRLGEFDKFTDLNEFVKKISFYSTWIGGFGIWKSAFESLDNFSRSSKLQLVQTDVLLRMISLQKKIKGCVCNQKLCESVVPNRKGGYNVINVFCNNYLGLLECYVHDYTLSKKEYNIERRRLYFKHLLPYLLDIKSGKQEYIFSTDNFFRILMVRYSNCFYFYLGMVALYVLIFKRKCFKSLVIK